MKLYVHVTEEFISSFFFSAFAFWYGPYTVALALIAFGLGVEFSGRLT